jgi:hypothetical protein
MTERLIRIALRDGTHIAFRREGKTLEVCHEDHCVILPEATGKQTLDLAVLLESFGEIAEEENE